MRSLIGIIVFLLAPSAFADERVTSSYPGGLGTAAIKMEVPADHVVIPIAIFADVRDPVERVEALNAAITLMTKEIAKRSGMTARVSVASVTARKASMLSSASGGTYARLTILAELSDADLFSKTAEAYRAVARLELPRDVRLELGDSSLGVDDPESYRDRLLQALRRQLDLTRETLGETKTISLVGLDNPVRLSQMSNTSVLLYLEYDYKIDM